ncbi:MULTISPECIES: tyrosine-type recombinase/integrase [Rhizobium]|uniref:Tyrosine-type recombinase/integrase n=1 Tax=Rhizobium phaseoli TaxID=396 RepID=A0A7X6J0A8_9HYPH|nr:MULTISPECIES: integrase arm-type DNA-binding domain-containing protein [Rhizobium]ANL40398.1 integrase family protein [Rhizobium phaseoli]ANL59386.1 integrase family protein [Rhizobium phaseoli]MDE8761238.1 tyrosine-type recombinase/integrase [Rhizobium sp. CBK13]NKF12958.1 tyrosine-type recombinase/integrase [Rhizobium phaseoli]QPK10774.1 tyrosine-type recombinase/integrase [Rhizobium phaseoli]
MARELHRLSTRGIESTIKKGTEGYGAHNDGGGLTLVIDKFGARWLFKFTSPVTGKRREMGLGTLATVSLADAREKASEGRGLIAKGLDPLIERDRTAAEALRDSVTFEQCANDTRDILSKKWTFAGAVDQWDRIVKELGDLRSMSVKDIRGVDIAKVLSVFDDRPSSKKVALSVIRRTMETAVASELREDNPAMTSRVSRLTSLDYKRGHHPSMPYADVPAFVGFLRSKKSRSARALELLILTGTRKDEVAGMTLAELDLDKCLWTIPEDITKQRREHVVPLTHRAVEILRQQLETINRAAKAANARSRDRAATPDYVWGNGRHARLSHNAFVHLIPEGATVHGFRSSLREYLGDETTVSWNTAEEVIGHKVGNETAKAYRRVSGITKRRAALQYWADFIEGNLNETANKVDKTSAAQGIEEQAA